MTKREVAYVANGFRKLDIEIERQSRKEWLIESYI